MARVIGAIAGATWAILVLVTTALAASAALRTGSALHWIVAFAAGAGVALIIAPVMLRFRRATFFVAALGLGATACAAGSFFLHGGSELALFAALAAGSCGVIALILSLLTRTSVGQAIGTVVAALAAAATAVTVATVALQPGVPILQEARMLETTPDRATEQQLDLLCQRASEVAHCRENLNLRADYEAVEVARPPSQTPSASEEQRRIEELQRQAASSGQTQTESWQGEDGRRREVTVAPSTETQMEVQQQGADAGRRLCRTMSTATSVAGGSESGGSEIFCRDASGQWVAVAEEATFELEPLRFNRPEEMRINRTYLVEARIGAGQIATLGSVGETVERQVQVPASRRVRVELISDAFTVEKLHQVEAPTIAPGGAALWSWHVTPTRGGNQILLLQVFGVVEHAGTADTSLIETYREEIPVRITLIDQAELTARGFLSRWELVVGISGAISGAWVFLAGLIGMSRSGRRAQTVT